MALPSDDEATYEPNGWDVAAKQVEEYEGSGGREGTTLNGAPCIILTTLGRKSGNLRKAPLIRVEHQGRYAVIASMGGAPKHPVWYLNLEDEPEVRLQDGPVKQTFRARTVEGDERAEWWARATEVWPAYDEYQTKTDRQIPVVVLDPVDPSIPTPGA
jgi:deazaflavin-dependent oxidoreductase (nitroreductase family)